MIELTQSEAGGNAGLDSPSLELEVGALSVLPDRTESFFPSIERKSKGRCQLRILASVIIGYKKSKQEAAPEPTHMWIINDERSLI